MRTPVRLVERQGHLQTLLDVVAGTSHAGRVILLSAEAGHGKTSLIRSMLGSLDHRYVTLETACEPVGIPTAFAPLYDVLDSIPSELRRDLRQGAGRAAVNGGVLDFLKNERVVLIVEDVHWADEATLGLIRYIGRRIESTNSCLIVTYRSEDLDLSPQLRLVVADVGPGAARVELPALTLEGVAELARDVAVDPEEIYRISLGNPFLVEELVLNPHTNLPPNVQNAVLASVGQLHPVAMEVLNAVSLSADGIDFESIAALVGDADAHLDELLKRRLLKTERSRVACRHDLIRESLISAMPAATKRRLHRTLLSALEGTKHSERDLARLAYHSIGAGDPEKALDYSVRAGREAAKVRAHRQAAYHLANAVEADGDAAPDALSDLLLEAAHEHCFINAFEAASDFAGRRIELAQSGVDEAKALAWLAFFRSRENKLESCHELATGSVAELSQHAPCGELALAMSVLSWVALASGDWEKSVEYGEESVAVARSVGDPSVEVHAATSVALALFFMGDRDGRRRMDEAVELGLKHDVGESTARALNDLAVLSLVAGRLDVARGQFNDMVEYAMGRELDAWYLAGLVSLGWIDVFSGRWDEADSELETVRGQRTCLATEVEYAIAAATLRMRRGDPGADDLVNDVVHLADGFADRTAVLDVCALIMEAAWVGLIPEETAFACLDSAKSAGHLESSKATGMVRFWSQRLGWDESQIDVPWSDLGFVVEAAIADAVGPGADLGSSFTQLERMGAEGVVKGLRRELQRRGVKGVPRGIRSTTKLNPAGLTVRESEVLGFLATGMSNAAIADRLFISEKTISHHVSSILGKLGASNRTEAVSIATADGLLEPVVA